MIFLITTTIAATIIDAPNTAGTNISGPGLNTPVSGADGVVVAVPVVEYASVP